MEGTGTVFILAKTLNSSPESQVQISCSRPLPLQPHFAHSSTVLTSYNRRCSLHTFGSALNSLLLTCVSLSDRLCKIFILPCCLTSCSPLTIHYCPFLNKPRPLKISDHLESRRSHIQGKFGIKQQKVNE